eukprot:TRINITY_DN109170_c0_g1_i1.p1 TRINITY_DN109170_c0_g1~~TRINITY_DN109170_c0_g1_i1.p1  ORF type:complete len:583 (+),score=153.20 TRINITY_DN109170_c0_g1_i1:36-1751(+)
MAEADFSPTVLEMPLELTELLEAATGEAMKSAPPGGLPPGMPPGLWAALCTRRMEEIHRSHAMSTEEKEALLRSRTLQIPGKPSGRSISILEDPSGHFGAGCTGAVLWPAAEALVEKLDSKVESSKKLRSVELGAGLGAIGLFLALHKGFEVVVTESPESMELLARNVHKNFPAGDGPQVSPVRWGDSEQLEALGTFDLVVGSDVTYRPDCLDDLLASAAELMKPPNARFFLSLQDRPAEAANLEDAISRTGSTGSSKRRLQVVHRQETVMKTHFDPADAEKGEPGDDVTILIYELKLDSAFQPPGRTSRSSDAASSSAGFPNTPAEVEEEFFRLTGIRPEPVVIPKRPSAEPEIKAKNSSSIKGKDNKSYQDRVTEDLIKMGLEDYLDDADGKPKTQGRGFMEEVMAQAAKEDWSQGGAKKAAMDAHDAEKNSKGVKKNKDDNSEQKKPEKSDAASEHEDASSKTTKSKVETKTCLDGLEWEVQAEEAEFVANVTFGDELWLRLCGVSALNSFKEAVSFELAEKELRVLHAGVVVLALILPFSVDPDRAAASVSSRKRRVAVRAPKVSAK